MPDNTLGHRSGLQLARVSLESGAFWLGGPQGEPVRTTVLLHHRSGIDEFVVDVAARLVERGHRVGVPELYGALRPTGEAESAKRALVDDQVAELLSDIAQALTARGARGVGALGFCMGGRFAFLAATAGCGIDRACCFYGGEIDNAWNSAISPVGRVAAGVAPVQLLRGSSDSNATGLQADAAIAAFDAVGGTLEAITYAGARHAFANHLDTDRFHPTYAERAWKAGMDFLEDDCAGARP